MMLEMLSILSEMHECIRLMERRWGAGIGRRLDSLRERIKKLQEEIERFEKGAVVL